MSDLVLFLRALMPRAMADDLAVHADDPVFVAEQVRTYLTANADSQAEMAAFHESGGLGMVAKAIEKITPSADELATWLKEEDEFSV